MANSKSLERLKNWPVCACVTKSGCPWAAYNPPLSAVQLSKRNKGLVCPSSTSHTARSLEAKQTSRILRVLQHPQSPPDRTVMAEMYQRHHYRAELRFLLYLTIFTWGLWWLPLGQYSISVPLPTWFLGKSTEQEADGGSQERRLFRSRTGGFSGRCKKCVICPSPQGTERAPS